MKRFLLVLFFMIIAVTPAAAQTFGNSNHILGASILQTTNLVPVADTLDIVLVSTAATIEVVSTSTSDASAGTGVRTVKISGLDSNWAEISETVTLDGTTKAVSINSYLRINKIEAVTAGTGLVAAGIIKAYLGSELYAQISVGNVESQNAIYSVPADTFVNIKGWRVSAASNPAKFELQVRSYGKGYKAIDKVNLLSSEADITFEEPLTIAPKSDVVIKCATTTGVAAVTASMFINK